MKGQGSPLLKEGVEQEKFPPPALVNFVITRECNLRCKHCYTSATDSPHPHELDTAEAKRVIKEIAQAEAHLLIFDGGEPLMRADIYELIPYATEVGLYTGMVTNGTLLSTEVAERLKEAGLKALAITFYSPHAKSHDDFTGIEGSWERTLAGIKNAQGASIPFQIDTCIHKQNFAQFESIAKLAKESGAQALEVFNFMPVGRGKEHPELVLDVEEQRDLISKIIHYQATDEEMHYECIGIPQLWVELDKSGLEEEKRRRFVKACCGIGLRYCCIFYEGTVFPCAFLHRRAGNIREESFKKIWQEAEVFKTLRNRDKLEGKCRHCAYRQFCGGARCLVFEKTNSLTEEDRACWFKKEEIERAL